MEDTQIEETISVSRSHLLRCDVRNEVNNLAKSSV